MWRSAGKTRKRREEERAPLLETAMLDTCWRVRRLPLHLRLRRDEEEEEERERERGRGEGDGLERGDTEEGEG